MVSTHTGRVPSGLLARTPVGGLPRASITFITSSLSCSPWAVVPERYKRPSRSKVAAGSSNTTLCVGTRRSACGPRSPSNSPQHHRVGAAGALSSSGPDGVVLAGLTAKRSCLRPTSTPGWGRQYDRARGEAKQNRESRSGLHGSRDPLTSPGLSVSS